MNNLKTLRQLFGNSLTDTATTTSLTTTELSMLETNQLQPSVHHWQSLAEFYANLFHVENKTHQTEPIHFRLSVDYLMNIGLTLNDLLAMKWFVENKSYLGHTFAVALFEPNIDDYPTTVVTDLTAMITAFAGYLLLNHDGSMNQFIDERHNNHISDWRLLAMKDDTHYVDITTSLIYFTNLPDKSVY